MDISLFTYHKPGIHLFLFVYVDNIILIGTHSNLLASIIKRLQEEFAVTPPKLALANLVESLAIYPFKPTGD